MSTHDNFKETSTGEPVCPSGCLSTASCEKLTLFVALNDSSEKLEAMTESNERNMVFIVDGDHRRVLTESEVHRNLQAALAGSCLLYRQLISES